MKPLAALSALTVGACSLVGIRDTEEPHYTVRERVGTVEIREYGPRIAAETTVAGDAWAARSTGFRRLAGYIFGDNVRGDPIAMTAPVAQDRAPPSKGETIAMTAPVAQDRDATGAYVIRFYMPAGFTLQSLPRPNEAAVRLVEVPSETLAVLRFSGIASPTSIEQRSAELRAALVNSTWRPTGRAPVAWFYDPPWTLPPLRRNEVAIAVSRDGSSFEGP